MVIYDQVSIPFTSASHNRSSSQTVTTILLHRLVTPLTGIPNLGVHNTSTITGTTAQGLVTIASVACNC